MSNLLARLLPSKTEQRHDINTVDDWIKFGPHLYPVGPGVAHTMPGVPVPAVDGNTFVAFAEMVFKQSVPVFALQAFRLRVFSSVRFGFQRMRDGRPQDIFGNRALRVLERPWEGGTTQDLLRVALMYHDLAGNAYAVQRGREIVFLRPDWVRVVFAERPDRLGVDVFGYLFYPDGDLSGEPEILAPSEVAHFMGEPDPVAPWRGMSWLTPTIREFQLDQQSIGYAQQYLSNSATPNLAVSVHENVGLDAFKEFVARFKEGHEGVENSGKTLFMGGGADVKVVGADLSKLALRDTQGGFETRLASAAGVHPVMVGFREGMQGSSLNAGNYGMARRSTADGTFHPLWQDVAGSFEQIIQTPADARLWYDARGVPFLREDAKDIAEIQQSQATAIRTLADGGFDPDSIRDAILADDWSLLKHTGMPSVQLQPDSQGEEE